MLRCALCSLSPIKLRRPIHDVIQTHALDLSPTCLSSTVQRLMSWPRYVHRHVRKQRGAKGVDVILHSELTALSTTHNRSHPARTHKGWSTLSIAFQTEETAIVISNRGPAHQSQIPARGNAPLTRVSFHPTVSLLPHTGLTPFSSNKRRLC